LQNVTINFTLKTRQKEGKIQKEEAKYKEAEKILKDKAAIAKIGKGSL